jgi:hypothetical protein
MMTQKTKVTIQHNHTTCGLEGVTMPFMILVMHTLPEMKDLKQHMMRKTEVTIQHDNTPCG